MDGSIVVARWHQRVPQRVHPNRHPHRTSAAPCWIALDINCHTCPDVLVWPPFPSQIAPSHVDIRTPIQYMVPLVHLRPQSKQHHDQFILQGSQSWQTDWQTDPATPSVAIGCI